MSKQRTRPKKATPDWITDTPAATYQLLSLWGDGFKQNPPQEIPLTIEEYEALKRGLAKMRGYAAPEAVPEPEPAATKPKRPRARHKPRKAA